MDHEEDYSFLVHLTHKYRLGNWLHPFLVLLIFFQFPPWLTFSIKDEFNRRRRWCRRRDLSCFFEVFLDNTSPFEISFPDARDDGEVSLKKSLCSTHPYLLEDFGSKFLNRVQIPSFVSGTKNDGTKQHKTLVMMNQVNGMTWESFNESMFCIDFRLPLHSGIFHSFSFNLPLVYHLEREIARKGVERLFKRLKAFQNYSSLLNGREDLSSKGRRQIKKRTKQTRRKMMLKWPEVILQKHDVLKTSRKKSLL